MREYKSKLIRLPGIIKWEATTPPGTSIVIRTLSSDDKINWSASQPYTNPKGSKITSPEKRFIRFSVQLKTENPCVTPVLHKVWIYYCDKILEYGGDVGWD